MTILRWVFIKFVNVRDGAEQTSSCDVVEASGCLVAKDVVSILEVKEVDDRSLHSRKVIAPGLLSDAGNL